MTVRKEGEPIVETAQTYPGPFMVGAQNGSEGSQVVVCAITGQVYVSEELAAKAEQRSNPVASMHLRDNNL